MRELFLTGRRRPCIALSRTGRHLITPRWIVERATTPPRAAIICARSRELSESATAPRAATSPLTRRVTAAGPARCLRARAFGRFGGTLHRRDSRRSKPPRLPGAPDGDGTPAGGLGMALSPVGGRAPWGRSRGLRRSAARARRRCARRRNAATIPAARRVVTLKARQSGHGGGLDAHRGAAPAELVKKPEVRELVQFLIGLLSRLAFPNEHLIFVGAQ